MDETSSLAGDSGNGFLDTVSSLLGTAGSIYQAVQGNNATPAQTAKPATSIETANNRNLFLVIGGGVLVLLAVIFFLRK